MASELTVPDEYSEWPHDARRFVLAEANTMEDLRREIDALVGIPSGEYGDGSPTHLTKDEMAAIVMALGGPQGVTDA